MVQSGVVQSPFRRGRGVANKRGLRVRKVKKKNLTEKLLPSWPTLTLAFEVLAVSFQVSFLRLLAADCVFDASDHAFPLHDCKCFLGTCHLSCVGYPGICVGCGKVVLCKGFPRCFLQFRCRKYHPTYFLSS